MELLKSLAYLLAFYGMYGIFKGEVYCKDGIRMRYVYKRVEPVNFWLVCGSYIFVGALIAFVANNKYG